MKPTSKNQVEYNRRVAARLAESNSALTHKHEVNVRQVRYDLVLPGADPLEKARAHLQVRYPHLTRKTPIHINSQGLPPYTLGGMGLRLKTLRKKSGGALIAAQLSKNVRPQIKIRPSASRSVERGLFILGHELRHAVDVRKKSGWNFVGKELAAKAFVPYGLRPSEWRANITGLKVARTEQNAKQALKLANSIHASYVRLGLAGAGIRTGALLGTIAAVRAWKKHKQNLTARQLG